MARSLVLSLLVLLLSISTSCLEAYNPTNCIGYASCGYCPPPLSCHCDEPAPCMQICGCRLPPSSPQPPSIPPVEKNPPPPASVPKSKPPVENNPPPTNVPKSQPPPVCEPPPVERNPPPPVSIPKPNPAPVPVPKPQPSPPVQKNPPPPVSVPKPNPPVEKKPPPPTVAKPNPPSPKKPQPPPKVCNPCPSTPKPPAKEHHPKCPNPRDYCQISDRDFYIVKLRKKCWCSVQHCKDCFAALWTAVIHDFKNINKDCCEAFLKVDENCHKLMFERYGHRLFVYRLKQHCSQFY